MGYLSYGHESLIFVILLLALSSLLLDLVPLLYKVVRERSIAAPADRFGVWFVVVAAGCGFLSLIALS